MNPKCEWQHGKVAGYVLREGNATIAVIAPTNKPGTGWIAARLDEAGDRFFPYLRHAAEWCEATHWYGPAASRMQHNRLRHLMMRRFGANES
jgi:hypothetical protein